MKTMKPTVKTVNNFVTCLSSIQKAYAQKGDGRHFAYGKAISSMKNLGFVETLRCLVNGHKIAFVGKGITDKWNEYVSKGKISKMKELGIKPNVVTNEDLKASKKISKKSEKVSENPHKHYTKREDIPLMILPLFRYFKVYGEPIITGSYRRQKAMVGDIDLLYVGKAFDKTPEVQKGSRIELGKGAFFIVTASGEKKMKGELHNHRKVIEVDFRIFPKSQLGSALCYFTGPFEHNIHLRVLAKSKGMKLSEYGITDKEGKLHKFSSEKGMYKFLGTSYKEPWERGV